MALVVALVAATIGGGFQTTEAAAQFQKSQVPQKKSALPKVLAKVQRFRVQIRHPRPVVRRAVNLNAAKAMAANLRRGGWNAVVKHDRIGHFVVSKMPRWKDRGIAANRGIASGMANVLRGRGFEVRLLPIS